MPRFGPAYLLLEDAEYLAALMVATAEAAGTRAVALLTDMDQPLGRMAGEPVDPHAGIQFKARLGAKAEVGQPIAVLYATNEAMLPEPSELLTDAIAISDLLPDLPPLVSRVFTRESAEDYLESQPKLHSL